MGVVVTGIVIPLRLLPGRIVSIIIAGAAAKHGNR
jgi:hypothetical protein